MWWKKRNSESVSQFVSTALYISLAFYKQWFFTVRLCFCQPFKKWSLLIQTFKWFQYFCSLQLRQLHFSQAFSTFHPFRYSFQRIREKNLIESLKGNTFFGYVAEKFSEPHIFLLINMMSFWQRSHGRVSLSSFLCVTISNRHR